MTTDELFLYSILVFGVLVFVMRFLKAQAIMNEAIKHVVAKHVHEIKSEQHGDMLYWFDKTSDQFFAQGKTMDDCIAQLKQVYPGHVFLYDALNKQYLLVGPDFEPILVDDGKPLTQKDFE